MGKLTWVLALACAGCGGLSDSGNVGYPFAITCVDGFSDEQTAEIWGAAGEWRDRSDGRVDLEPGDDCTLRVRPWHGAKVGGVDAAGLTLGESIQLNPDEPAFYIMSLHEFGHYVSGYTHSRDPADVMFPGYTGQTHLTDRDVARLP